MIKEIYCRIPSYAGYNPKIIECENTAEEILQRCRVCLGTKPGDILGDPFFGIDLEEYIFDMSVDVDEIREKVNSLLNNYALLGMEDEWHLSSEVYFGHNTTDMSDYLFIDIYLNDQKALGIIVT